MTARRLFPLALLALAGCARRETLPPAPLSAPPAAAPTPASPPATPVTPPAPPPGDSAYPCEISAPADLGQARSGDTVDVPVTLVNRSTETWPTVSTAQPRGVNLAYHWLDAEGKWAQEGDRTPLPKELKPGETVELKLRLKIQGPAGVRALQIEPVYETLAWFTWKGGCSARSRVDVAP